MAATFCRSTVRRNGLPTAAKPSAPAKTIRTIEVLYSERHDTSSEPRAAGTGTCPKATTCTVHQTQRARWLTDSTGKVTIKWKFNDEGRRSLRAPPGLLESAIKSGMAEWQRWNSNVQFAYVGTTTAQYGARGSNGTCDDGNNVIGWARMDRDIIAQVMTCLDSSGRRVVDADLALNVTQHWEDIKGEPESRHTFDIRSIVTHELGHILSLADLYSSDAMYMTMMGNAKYGETRKRTLGLGDIIGVQTAYKCGSGDSCPRRGIVND
jgi:predicted Zn-dependent protease